MFTGTDSVTKTEAGTYPMGLAAAQFSYNDANFETVTFNVTDGELKINKATLTVTSDTLEKVYGSEDPKLTYSVDGLQGEDTVDMIIVTVDRDPGEDVGEYNIVVSGEADQGNYVIEFVSGTMRINSLDVTVTITGNSSTEKADGIEKTVEGYTVEFSSDLYSEDDMTFSGTASVSGIEPGVYSMGLSSNQFTNNNNNFNVTFVVIDGELTIDAPDTFFITYDLNGGTYDGKQGIIEETYTKGTVISIHEAPTREGYVFLYWKGSEYQPGDSYTVEGDHTFTAQWKKEEKKEDKDDKHPTPKTGDETRLDVWIMMMIVSMIGLGALFFASRKMKKDPSDI